MREEQRAALRTALKEVHDRVHELYPRETEAIEGGQELRNRLLVVDLAVHLADEVVAASSIDKEKVVERTANLLFAVRLLAPQHALANAANLLLAESDNVKEG